MEEKAKKSYIIRDPFSDDRIDGIVQKLLSVYSQMPSTTGCLEHINKSKEEGGCGGWCCAKQSPQVLYSEFINTWKYILKSWSINDVVEVIERSIKNYLSQDAAKGCVFFDKEKKLCKIYKTRSFNCRIYSIIPQKEFEARIKRLILEYKDKFDVMLRDQCDLVKTENGKEVTIEDTDKWWKELSKIESILVSKDQINDQAEGSYRAYHDHILLQLFHPNTLMDLTQIRLNGTKEERQKAINVLVKSVWDKVGQKLKNTMSGRNNEQQEITTKETKPCQCEKPETECKCNSTECQCEHKHSESCHSNT